MAKLVYKCRYCSGKFERENLKGRLPKACPTHRYLLKNRRVDSSPRRERPPCCAQLAPGRVCAQHRQWRSFKSEWVRRVKPQPGSHAAMVLADLFLPPGEDGSTQNSGFSIVTLGRNE
jgi:DNA-directed RNA polymerase subunit RPC12/RpoP